MKTLLVLDDCNYTDAMPVSEKYTVRAVIIRDGKMAMQQSGNGIYKIPGGGIEAGESHHAALIREVKEETGLTVIEASIRPIGEILEIREDLFARGTKYLCHAYFYFCEVTQEVCAPQLTESEEKKGFCAVWADIKEIAAKNRAVSDEKEQKLLHRDTCFVELLRDGLVMLRPSPPVSGEFAV